MEIEIKKLQEYTDILLMNMKDNIGDKVKISKDFYWDINDKEMYNPNKTPEELTLGQLSDDFQELERVSYKENVISNDIKRLSQILRAISVENVW